MRIKAQLDADEFAWTGPERVRLLVDVEAPSPPGPDSAPGRAGTRLQIVLDGRGVTGPGIEGVLDAVVAIVHRLDERDVFGLVWVGDGVEVAVPAGPLTDKEAVVELLAGVRPGDTGDLLAGYRRGIEEARRTAGEDGGTVLVVSGRAGGPGPEDWARLTDLARSARDTGIRTSTLHHGLDNDSSLAALAESGGGCHHVAVAAPGTGAAIAHEVGLPSSGVESARLVVQPADDVDLVSVDGRPPPDPVSERTHIVELRDLDFDEQQRFTVDLRLNAPRSHRLTLLGTLELRYSDVGTMEVERVVIPAILQAPLPLCAPVSWSTQGRR